MIRNRRPVTRTETLIVACLLAASLLAACGGDDTDQPPRAVIVHPQPGDHLTIAPDSVVVQADDDRGINRVEMFLDGQLIATVGRAPYQTLLPLGTYADGRPHVLRARAYDSRAQTGEAPSVAITIDPALQTVPQITSLAPAASAPSALRLAWLPWPHGPATFAWEAARDDGFARILASGSASDTLVQLSLDPTGIVYARVRAVTAEATSGWCRPARHSGLATWRRQYAAAGPQLGCAMWMTAGGDLLILSQGADGHPVDRAAVQALSLTAQGELLAIEDLLPDSDRPTARLMSEAGCLIMAGRREPGASFLAGCDPGGGRWVVQPQIMATTALVETAAGDLLAIGADRRPGKAAAAGGLFAAVTGQGDLAFVASFPLLDSYEVRQAWARPDGGYVLAGQVLAEGAGSYGGVWLLGLAPADAGAHEILWSVRLGTAERWLLCAAGTDGAGNFVVAGAGRPTETASRYGFLAAVDQQGRVRWQVTDRNWQQFSGLAGDVGGRWVAVGARRRDVGDQRYEYDTALRGLSPHGATLWESSHRAGRNTQAWAVVAHPAGGWLVAGARLDSGGGWDVDVLRLDDRGEMP